jgi:hypothetical protein
MNSSVVEENILSLLCQGTNIYKGCNKKFSKIEFLMIF